MNTTTHEVTITWNGLEITGGVRLTPPKLSGRMEDAEPGDAEVIEWTYETDIPFDLACFLCDEHGEEIEELLIEEANSQ